MAKGMAVTLKYLLTPAITVQYPDQKLATAPRFRGMLVLEPARCISCKLCEKICPDDCIHIEAHPHPQTKKWVLDKFILDFGRCSWCRLCEEACPVNDPVKGKVIKHSPEYEVTFRSRREMIYDMMTGKPMA